MASNLLQLKKKDNYLAVAPENKTRGGRGENEASFYRMDKGNGLEHLSCKLRFRDFRPHPRQIGTSLERK